MMQVFHFVLTMVLTELFWDFDYLDKTFITEFEKGE